MHLKILFSLFSLLFTLILQAQDSENKSWCNLECEYTPKDRETSNLVHLRMKNDSIRSLVNSQETIKFPIRIGVVQSDTNSISLSEIEVREVLNQLNKSFTTTGFLFYLDRIDIIKSDLSLEDLSNNINDVYDEFSQKNDLTDLLTIYVLNHKKEFCEISNNRISCARTGGFSYILSDRTTNIVVSRFDLSDPKIVAHEMGHFFGLYHTFEEQLFGKDTFDKGLCSNTGDRICDTPPDPGTVFEIYVNYSTCEMIGLKDRHGNEYKPALENYMSYYKPCYLKEYSFTEGQRDFMKHASMIEIRKKLSR